MAGHLAHHPRAAHRRVAGPRKGRPMNIRATLLLDLIDSTRFAAGGSGDTEKSNLHSVSLASDGERWTASATNGYRLVIRKIRAAGPVFQRFQIPWTCLETLSISLRTMGDANLNVEVEAPWLRLDMGDYRISLVDVGPFPDVDKLLSQELKQAGVTYRLDRKHLLSVLARAASFAPRRTNGETESRPSSANRLCPSCLNFSSDLPNESNGCVLMVHQDGRLLVRSGFSNDKDPMVFEEGIIATEPAPVPIYINGHYLVDTLHAMVGEMVSLRLPHKEFDPVLLWAGTGDPGEAEHVSMVMPVRHEGEKQWLAGVERRWDRDAAAMRALEETAALLQTEPMRVPGRMKEMLPLLKRIEELEGEDALRARIKELEDRIADQRKQLNSTTVKLFAASMKALTDVAEALGHELVLDQLPPSPEILTAQIAKLKAERADVVAFLNKRKCKAEAVQIERGAHEGAATNTETT